METTAPKYRIHPAIGIARVGDAPEEFYIAPEHPAARPIDCDSQGNPKMSPDGTHEMPVATFKDAEGRIKRQAARFRIFAYDDEHPEGRPLSLGDTIQGGGNQGQLVDIVWQVYPANKKSAWYEFRGNAGEAGYTAEHPLRNADITDPNARQQLIIDPGPHILNATAQRRAEFSRDGNPVYATTFPPKGLWPHDIDTLGTAMTDAEGRLLVLGGHGRSGTYKTGIGQPRIDNYANTDGWFDDTSDGPVMARLVMYSPDVDRLRYVDVEYPAWVVSAYPRYVPEMLDMITMEEVVENLAVTQFAYRTDLYGTAGTFGAPRKIDPRDQEALTFWRAGRLEWNGAFRPWFWRDIWPILFRPNEFNWVSTILIASNAPHDQTSRGTFDPDRLCQPPKTIPGALRRRERQALANHAAGLHAADALEPALIAEAGDKPIDPDVLAATMEKLAAAFAAFVAAMAPPDANAPDAYLVRWHKVFNANISNPSQAYLAATQSLASTVGDILAPAKPMFATDRREDPAEIDPTIKLSDRSNQVLMEFRAGKLLEAALVRARAAATVDPFGPNRRFLFDVLRRPGEENVFRIDGNPATRNYHLPLMPLLAGDNPLYNESPSKFLRLTDMQLFLLRQWAEGKFIDEYEAGLVPTDPRSAWQPYTRAPIATGRQLDRGVLSNALGGAFFPGGEIGWIIRNPAIWWESYRLKADPEFFQFQQTAAQENALASGSVPLGPSYYIAYAQNPLSLGSNYAVGLQPGDLTKMGPLPWQADFNECTTQDIDVTYEGWNKIDPDNPEDPVMRREQQVWNTMWWPAHRPLQVAELVDNGTGKLVATAPQNWSGGVPQTNAGDLKMVTAWTALSFVVLKNNTSPANRSFVGVERGKDMA